TPVSRIFFLLGFSLDPERAWRDEREGVVDTGAYDDVVPALAHAVERRIDAALRQGVLQGYREVEETSLVVRGRIREAEQIRRHFGRTPPVEIAYDATPRTPPRTASCGPPSSDCCGSRAFPAPCGGDWRTSGSVSPARSHWSGDRSCRAGSPPASTRDTSRPCGSAKPFCAAPRRSTERRGRIRSPWTVSCST